MAAPGLGDGKAQRRLAARRRAPDVLRAVRPDRVESLPEQVTEGGGQLRVAADAACLVSSVAAWSQGAMSAAMCRATYASASDTP